MERWLYRTKKDMEKGVVLATAWRRRRYTGEGYTFIFEQLQVSSGDNGVRDGG
jgi:hypothetical protein